VTDDRAFHFRSRHLRFERAAILLAAGLALAAARPAPDTRATRARTLDRWALEIVNRDATIEERQRAMRYIEEALALEPDFAGHWLVLGRLRDLAEEDMLARSAYRRSIALAPAEPEARMRLGRSWKRTWLRTLNPEPRDLAIAQFDTVTRLRPYGSPAWVALVPLLYERGELARAADAAERALAGRPRRPEMPLAAAYMGYRVGEIALADSLFREAIPQLDPDMRALFEDPLRLLGAPVTRDSILEVVAESLDPPRPSDSAAVDRLPRPPPPSASLPFAAPRSAPATGALLAELDPDPTTPQNEAELEVWSRIAHAYLLLADPRRPGLDARAETYIRYGPPAAVHMNPPGTPLYFDPNPTAQGRRRNFTEFPLDAQLWEYPDLGMHVLLHDRSLTARYTEPTTRDYSPGTTPDPGILARRPDLIALGGGRGVIATLPPAGQRLEVRGVVSAFEGERGPRLLVQARVPGAPGDTLLARWVVRDSAGREAARGEQSLAVSACDPAELRLAEFAAEVPAGRCDVAVSVRDARMRRGLFRTRLALAPAGDAVALSDLVLCCGDPSLVGDQSVRIEADPDATVTGARPLVAYFEIYRLASDRDGMSRFRYEYEVKRRADARDPRAIREAERRPPVDRWVSRDETNRGGMRRQFVRVQTASLTPGRYQLRVRVRDLGSGAEADRAAEFAKE
jgi:tetratricopeptide (TPR) repeat protein